MHTYILWFIAQFKIARPMNPSDRVYLTTKLSVPTFQTVDSHDRTYYVRFGSRN